MREVALIPPKLQISQLKQTRSLTDNYKVEISDRGINCFWLFATTSETTRAHADHGAVLALLAEASC